MKKINKFNVTYFFNFWLELPSIIIRNKKIAKPPLKYPAPLINCVINNEEIEDLYFKSIDLFKINL